MNQSQSQAIKILQVLLLAILVPVAVIYVVDSTLLYRLSFFDGVNANLLSGFRLENPHKKILSLVKIFLSFSIFFLLIFLIKSRFKVLKLALNLLDRNREKLVYVLGAIAFLTYISVFATLIINDKYVLNDFVRVTQRTILSPGGESVDDIQILNQYFISPTIIDRRPSTKVKPEVGRDDLKKFEAKNIVNQNIFDLRGYYFYHHAYNYGPIHQIHLEAPVEKIVAVYGYVAALTQEKILDFFGKVNFQGYLDLFYFEYIAYFIVFILFIQRIFRNYFITSICILLLTSSVLLLGIELIKLAPGFNPIRHFFDIFVFYFLYEYFKGKKNKDLLAAIAISIFSVLWSKDFGLYISLSILLSLVYFYSNTSGFGRANVKNTFICLIYFLAICVLFAFPMPGANPSAIYFVIGLGAPVLENAELIYWCIIILPLLILTFLLNIDKDYKYLAVFSCFYALSSFSYYAWYPKMHHIFGVGSIYVLWLLCICNAFKENKKILNFIVVIIFFLFFNASASFLRSLIVYNRNYQNHIVYEFDVNGNRLKSIGDPEYYKNSTDLIEKYSKNTPDIYLISKYDYILSILSSKYLNTGYVEIWSNLVSNKEIDKVVEAIKENKPPYLYVDIDITGKENFTKLSMEKSIGHLTRMRGNGVSRDITYEDAPMKEIYSRVKNLYYVCDKGLLIDVLCLKK